MSLLLKAIEKEMDEEQRIPTVFDLQAWMWIAEAADKWEVEMTFDDALDFVADIQKRLDYFGGPHVIRQAWNGCSTVHLDLLLRIFLIKRDYFPGRGLLNYDSFAAAKANYARSKIFNTNLKRISPIDRNALVVSDWLRNN